MDKESRNVCQIKPCFLSFALGLSGFVRSGRLAYLTMSMQGTWADGIIVPAVGDNLDLKIHITQSHPNLAEFTAIVEAATPQQQLRTICIGHLNEFHYMST